MSLLVGASDRVVPIRTILAVTTPVAVFTAYTGSVAKVAGPLYIVNTSAGAVNITVTITDLNTVIYTRYPLSALAASGVLSIDMEAHPLTASETINVTASVVNVIHVIGAVAVTG